MSAPKIMQEFMMKHKQQQALLQHEAVQNLNTLIDRAKHDDSLIDKAIVVFKQFDAVNLERVFDTDNRWAAVIVKRCSELLQIILNGSHELAVIESFLDALLNTHKVEIENGKMVVGLDTVKKVNEVIDSIQNNAVRLKLKEYLVSDSYLKKQQHKFLLSAADIKTLKEFVPTTTAKVNQSNTNQSHVSTSTATVVNASNTAASVSASSNSKLNKK